MNYAQLRPIDVANGPGVRVSLFVSGCTHACPGCFNPEAWDFGYGQPFTQTEAEQVLDDQGRTLRDGNGRTAVSRQSAAAWRSAFYGEPADHRRCELADAALSAGNCAA